MKGVQAVELLGMEVEIWSGELENKLFGSLPSKSAGFGTPGKRKGSGQRVMPGWGSGSVGKRGHFQQKLGGAAFGHASQPRSLIVPLGGRALAQE